MSLPDQTVDVFLTGPNQLPSSRQGGLGRLTDLRDMVVTHFEPGNAKQAQRPSLAQRNGFRSLSLLGHSAADGNTESLAWSKARLLTSVGNSPVSIVNGMPRSFDGTDWASYSRNRVLTNKLQASPFHVGQSVMQANDQSWISDGNGGGSMCEAWIEINNDSNLSGNSKPSVWVGFWADNGAWTGQPRKLQSVPVAGQVCNVRVVNDGSRFWVFYGIQEGGGANNIHVNVYDVNGNLQQSTTTPMKWTSQVPGFWDVIKWPVPINGGYTVNLVQPNGTDPSSDNHVQFTLFGWSSGIITVSSTDSTVKCFGPVAWITNDIVNPNPGYSFGYLATVGTAGHRLFGYEINVVAKQHEFNSGIDLPNLPDTIIGYVKQGAGAGPDMYLTQSQPSLTSPSSGPAFDPQLRYITTRFCDWNNAAQSLVRQTNSVTAVSRAFKVDDDYYAVTYYQSGSGLTTPKTVSVSLTAGDFIYGAAEQDLAVSVGDFTEGSTFTVTPPPGYGVWATNAHAGFNVSAGDTAVLNTSSGADFGVPIGTAMVTFTFALYTGGAELNGSHFTIAGASANNGTWFCYESTPGSHTIRAWAVNNANVAAVPVVYGAAGTVAVTAQAQYENPTIGTAIPQNVTAFFGAPLGSSIGGSVTIGGFVNAGNNGTFTINRLVSAPGTSGYRLISGIAVPFYTGFWVNLVSQVTENHASTEQFSPVAPNRWFFTNAGVVFDSSFVGSSLNLADDTQIPTNQGTNKITAVPGGSFLDTGNATTLTAQIFSTPLPSASITLDLTKTPFTLFLQSVTFDFSYINAIVSLTTPLVPADTGLYKIVQIVDSHHVIVAPVGGSGKQVNHAMDLDHDTITILIGSGVAAQIQPAWFLTPVSDGIDTAQVGHFELGLAYADWHQEALVSTFGNSMPYMCQVTSPVHDNDGWRFCLPARAETVSVQSAQVIGGQVSDTAISANTVGMKQFKLLDQAVINNPSSYGQASGTLLPGPGASQIDGPSFVEHGINVGMEVPFLVTEAIATGPALISGSTYFYVPCLEASDNDGNRIWTAPAPSLQVTLTGTNTSVTISGRLPIPLSTLGAALAKHFGLTNRVNVNLALYRTCIQNGTPTASHFKITNDLNVNGLAPVSATNASGFAFPNEFTWTYKDENLDSVILSAEELYTDQGLLPRFQAPAFSMAVDVWQGRKWVLGYDGAISFSGELTEGEQDWYNPLFRVPPATGTVPTAIANLEGFLAVFTKDWKYQLPAFKGPAANGTNPSIPNLLKLPLPGGCTGILKECHGGVAYARTTGQVWFMTRDLRDEWLSKDFIDTFNLFQVTAMALDNKQKLHVATGTGVYLVYDAISQVWSRFIPGDAPARLLTAVNGVATYQSGTCVAQYQTDGIYYDAIEPSGGHVPITPGFTVSSLNFANVAGVKLCRLIQLRGTWKGPHNVLVTVSYPDQNPIQSSTVMAPFTPDPTKPYVIDCYPGIEEASSYGLDVQTSFAGVTPGTEGNTFELDVFSAEVAIDSRTGVSKSVQQASNG